MGENITLKAQIREATTKGQVKELRRQGMVPSILYGQGNEPIELYVKANEFNQVISMGGAKSLIILHLDSGKKMPVMLKEVQSHPVQGQFTHIDFLQVSLKEKINVEVFVNLTGEPVGVKEGGLLQQVLRTVTLECLPTNIPDSINHDISSLKIGDQILVKDLDLPTDVEVITTEDTLVANVVATYQAPVDEEATEESVVEEQEQQTEE